MIAALSKTKKHRQTLNIGNQWLNGRDKGRETNFLILNLLSPVYCWKPNFKPPRIGRVHVDWHGEIGWV